MSEAQEPPDEAPHAGGAALSAASGAVTCAGSSKAHGPRHTAPNNSETPVQPRGAAKSCAVSSEAPAVTRLLRAWGGGDEKALQELMPVVYAHLRAQAGQIFRNELPGHTLRPTALVHEAYIRLVDMDVSWQDRAHFFALAARLMRRILVDHARGRDRVKRGSGAHAVSLEDAMLVADPPVPDILELDRALTKLGAMDERKSRMVELLYFGGLTTEETAQAPKISPATLHRDLKLAKAWLAHEMSGGEHRPRLNQP
jgi:RNA polymerase sigma factor (TIGR02999 family)